ncbi:MAG: glucose-1-phosphate adenylyltransferase [Candidatus Coatesbacteria bacterium]|nr:glucose-1-phosphate adenylyltransferase [Candidatus Coatesbacteria bacterium]
MRSALAMILAGGRGKRLDPLTKDRTKPAVPFGGIYRLIDFTLSNCVNSGMRRIYVLTQYKSDSLNRHLSLAWRIYNRELGEYIDPIPAQQRLGNSWYQGTADAIYQNIALIRQSGAKYLFVLSGDHIYKMDYRLMLDFHEEHHAEATLAALEKPVKTASAFGVAVIDSEDRLIDFQEKPECPRPMPGSDSTCLVSMGVYLFNVDFLLEALKRDSEMDTEHDFGKNVIPDMMKSGRVCVYNFRNEKTHLPRYWEDIGTRDAYWQASMDLLELNPHFNLYNPLWPVRCYHGQYPPARTVFADDEQIGFTGNVLDSMISGGCVVVGATVKHSILSPDVRVKCYAEVTDSIIMNSADIGKNAKIRRAIIDKDVVVKNNARIGFDEARDRERFSVTRKGIVVVPKGAVIEA